MENVDIVFAARAPIVARIVVSRTMVRVDEETHWTACGIPMHMHHFKTRIGFVAVPDFFPVDDDELDA